MWILLKLKNFQWSPLLPDKKYFYLPLFYFKTFVSDQTRGRQFYLRSAHNESLTRVQRNRLSMQEHWGQHPEA